MEESSTEPPKERGSYLNPRLKAALDCFKEVVAYEKELSDESILLGHLRDHIKGNAFDFLSEGKSDDEIIAYIEEAQFALRKYRRDQHPRTDSIRVYRNPERKW